MFLADVGQILDKDVIRALCKLMALGVHQAHKRPPNRTKQKKSEIFYVTQEITWLFVLEMCCYRW